MIRELYYSNPWWQDLQVGEAYIFSMYNIKSPEI